MTEPLRRNVVLALYRQTWGNAAPRNYAYSPDRAVWGLATDPGVESLLVADPPRSLPGLLRDPSRTAPLPGDLPGRQLLHPLRWWPAAPRELAVARAARRHLDRTLQRRRSRDDAVLVTCDPLLAAVADRAAWADVVYYGWDEWSAFGWAASGVHGHLREHYLWAYRQMAARDVKVIGVSQAIVDRVGARRGVVVPNGIAAADFAASDDAASDDAESDDAGSRVAGRAQAPDWFTALPGKIALYAGSLEDRIDADALTACADGLGADWTIVLVGPMQAPDHFRDLLARPNVRVHGVLPRATVLAMMARADVGLVCHRDTPLTQAMSPLKLYEYLAAGLPVVATDLEPMRDVSPRCLLVASGDDWACAVRKAADLGPDDPEHLARFRAQHDWSNRYLDWRAAALSR